MPKHIPKAILNRERKNARYVVTHPNEFKQSMIGVAWSFLMTWGARDA
jgi:hypothetical protein